MSLFQKSVEKKYLNDLDSILINKKYTDFQNYFGNSERQENIRNSKEEQFQEGFLRELFVKILEYTLNPEPNFNLTTELKNITNSKKADGAILKGEDATAVIELKGTDTTDLDKIETQAFGYKNHHPKCKYVITSNFEKLRFYIQNAVDHVDFDLFNLTKEQFSLLWLCLAKDNLLNDLPLKIKESSVLQEENITKKLYADYSKFREAIYNNLVKNNPETDKLLLFKKTQKLLDRFLFIFFAEDRLLVPPNSITEIVKQWTTLKEELDEYFPLYTRFKKYFGYMNTGFKGKKYQIYAYNGGLFKPDEILDTISIDDDILHEHTLRLSNYDFETDVDVNILGHIFEHSLGEIENVQAEIKGEKVDSQKTKRKKDGIFYTPKYITKYIVENTVGKLCLEKRTELEIVDEKYAKGRKNRKKELVKTLDKKLDDYRNWLLSLTILDPACGSGAFLNQALEFLINEHRKIDELRGQLLGGEILFSDITTDILENNIYGVDLNEESVEIAKLSLWLRTAQKGRKLNTLSNNIKCGNSLIDDPEVAGEKAFNWQNEFPNIFKTKKKKVWHITTATHNSRYSQRMFDKHVKLGEPVWLTEKEEIIVTETIAGIEKKDKLNIVAYNICGDHAHILLVCEEEELHRIVQKLKSMSSRACNIAMGRTIPMAAHGDASRTGNADIGTTPEHASVYSARTTDVIGEHTPHATQETPVTPEHAPAHIARTKKGNGEHTPHATQETPATPEHAPAHIAGITKGNGEHTPHATLKTPATPEHAPAHITSTTHDSGEHAPLRGKTQFHLWTANADKKEITSNEQLNNTIAYINNNRQKHKLPENKELQALAKQMSCTRQHAFSAEYTGGFDVVIGNPPYVRAELLADFREYLQSKFSVFHPAGDLFSYFYEKSFQLLKPQSGLFGFISNTFDKTTAGVAVREYLQNEISFLKYIDFTEVQIFEGATTYPVIITAQNQKGIEKSFSYIKIPKASQSAIIDIDFHDSVIVAQNSLDKKNWSFKNKLAVNLIDKLKKNKTVREIYGKSYRGLLTGLNEAFIIPKTFSSNEHVKPIFEGKELSKWISQESVQQLILFESKWTKKKYGDEISEESALQQLQKDYSELINQILPFEVRAKKRYDKGEFFWELRNCAYYDLFEKPKIVFPNLQNNNKFAFDETGAFINAPAVILPTDDKFLLAVLNSKLVWYFLTNICVVRSGGYIEVKPQYFEQIPIPVFSEKFKTVLSQLTENIISKTSDSQKLSNKFINLLNSKFDEINITKKLEKWFELTFIDFQKELKKQKIKMSLSDESDWIDFFELQSKSYSEISNSINSLEKEIDQMVYELYGLTEEEIKIVENS